MVFFLHYFLHLHKIMVEFFDFFYFFFGLFWLRKWPVLRVAFVPLLSKKLSPVPVTSSGPGTGSQFLGAKASPKSGALRLPKGTFDASQMMPLVKKF